MFQFSKNDFLMLAGLKHFLASLWLEVFDFSFVPWLRLLFMSAKPTMGHLKLSKKKMTNAWQIPACLYREMGIVSLEIDWDIASVILKFQYNFSTLHI